MGWDSTNDSRLGTYIGYLYTSNFRSGKGKDGLVRWQAKRETVFIITRQQDEVGRVGPEKHSKNLCKAMRILADAIVGGVKFKVSQFELHAPVLDMSL
jgi:hypothetical protein